VVPQPGELRYEVNAAAAAGGGTVTFTLPKNSTIALAQGEIPINQNLVIHGPGASRLTISASPGSRIFDIQGPIVTIDNLTLANGRATSSAPAGTESKGGAIYCVSAVLILTCDAFSNNEAIGAAGEGNGGDGGSAFGGAIYCAGAADL